MQSDNDGAIRSDTVCQGNITPYVCLEIQDLTIGIAPGERMAFRLRIGGAQAQLAHIAVMISDPLGRARYHAQEQIQIAAGQHVHEMAWARVRRGQPGIYRLEAQVYLSAARQRIIASVLFELVIPGHPQSGRLCPANREGPIHCPREFPDVDKVALAEAWKAAATATEGTANEDGSYGKGYNECLNDKRVPGLTHPLAQDTACPVLAYLLASRLWPDRPYADLARRGLAFLVQDQDASGAFRWWGTPEGVLNDQDTFYPTGYGALALLLGHELIRYPGALEAVRRAGDWTLDKPVTGNANYDLFALWFLPRLYRLTGEKKYLASAVWRAEAACFDGQNPGGAWPGHNLSAGYHSIITLGLALLYRDLPNGHPFQARLRKRLVMAAAFLAALIAEDGSIYMGWEYNRRGFFVDWEGRPGGTRMLPIGCMAWWALRSCLEVDPGILRALSFGLCDAFRRHQQGQSVELDRRGVQDWSGYRGWADYPVANTLLNLAVLLSWAEENT